jgi:hypothetical protein
MGENHEGEKGELMPREKYAELLASSSQAVIIVAKLRRYIQQYVPTWIGQVKGDVKRPVAPPCRSCVCGIRTAKTNEHNLSGTAESDLKIN